MESVEYKAPEKVLENTLLTDLTNLQKDVDEQAKYDKDIEKVVETYRAQQDCNNIWLLFLLIAFMGGFILSCTYFSG